MVRRICPVCDQVMKKRHYCTVCKRWVMNPQVMTVNYYMNERHSSKENSCEYHDPSFMKENSGVRRNAGVRGNAGVNGNAGARGNAGANGNAGVRGNAGLSGNIGRPGLDRQPQGMSFQKLAASGMQGARAARSGSGGVGLILLVIVIIIFLLNLAGPVLSFFL